MQVVAAGMYWVHMNPCDPLILDHGNQQTQRQYCLVVLGCHDMHDLFMFGAGELPGECFAVGRSGVPRPLDAASIALPAALRTEPGSDAEGDAWHARGPDHQAPAHAMNEVMLVLHSPTYQLASKGNTASLAGLQSSNMTHASGYSLSRPAAVQ